MSNVDPFNYGLDKITERETVYDFISRISTGKDFINQDYNHISNNNDKQIIFPANTKLKDGILMNMIRTMDMSDIFNLDKIKTSYKLVNIGDTKIIIEIPDDCVLYRIMQEKTGHDVTLHFYKSGNTYIADLDTPATNTDTYKAYFYKN